jgi:ABC-type multidrug transport system fused ATPase/permease subunit
VSRWHAAGAPDRPRGSGRRARAWLWPLVRPHRGLVALGALAVLAQSGVDLALPFLVKVAIDDGVVPHRPEVVTRVVLAYLALAGAQLLAGRVEALSVAGAGQRVLFAVRRRLFGHLQALSLDFYERERTGGLVNRMTSDVEAMSNLLSSGLVNLVSSLVSLVGIVVVLVLLDWRLALATLTVTPLAWAASTWFRRRSAGAWRQVRETAAVVTVRLQEALTAVRAIQSFRRERTTMRSLADANRAERDAHRRTIALTSIFFPGMEFLGVVGTAVVLGFGGRRVLAGDLELGTLVAFLLYLRNLFEPVQQLSELYDTVQAATAGAERIGAVLAERPTVAEHPDAVALPEPRGEVRLDAVRFAYPAGGGDAPEVLHGVDLHVPAGSTLGLVGPTGAGKSTIAKLVARFYDPSGGRVLLDGLPLDRLRLADLRAGLGYVPQEGFLFSGSIADNIRFGRPDASRAEVEAAARAVGADQVVERLAGGYDAEVGERGVRLAAGERQLVAFARAWLADPVLLLLDEATSQLDAASEARVRQALRTLRRGRTTILIAHRLTSVLDADQVAVVEDGRVVEHGPPGELQAAGGRFAELYDRWLGSVA